MWTHYCTVENRYPYLEDWDVCSYCQLSKDQSRKYHNYPGKHWIYPAKRFVSWPESQRYYYYLDKNNS